MSISPQLKGRNRLWSQKQRRLLPQIRRQRLGRKRKRLFRFLQWQFFLLQDKLVVREIGNERPHDRPIDLFTGILTFPLSKTILSPLKLGRRPTSSLKYRAKNWNCSFHSLSWKSHCLIHRSKRLNEERASPTARDALLTTSRKIANPIIWKWVSRVFDWRGVPPFSALCSPRSGSLIWYMEREFRLRARLYSLSYQSIELILPEEGDRLSLFKNTIRKEPKHWFKGIALADQPLRLISKKRLIASLSLSSYWKSKRNQGLPCDSARNGLDPTTRDGLVARPGFTYQVFSISRRNPK